MQKTIFSISFLIYVFCITSFLHSQTATEKLNQQLTEKFQSTNIPGMAVAIVNKDQILYKNQFGYADISVKKPYTQNTSHNIGSTSKTFIGVAIMQLVEQGKVDLDTDINDYLPFKERLFHKHYVRLKKAHFFKLKKNLSGQSVHNSTLA